MTTEQHPAHELPAAERVDYLCVIASLASADGNVSDAELGKLRELCKALDVRGSLLGEVMAAADEPNESRVRRALSGLTKSPLRFTLMTDMLFMSYADGDFTADEQVVVRGIAEALGITDEQFAGLRRYVEAVQRAANTTGGAGEDFKKLGGELASALAGVGVPVAAVAVSGSVFGLSAAGITSGLAALGLGFGMVSGLGVVIGLGIGSTVGVRWLYRKAVGV